MKKLNYLLKSFLVVLFAIVFAQNVNAQTREERKLSGFTGIGLSIAADVYLTQSDTYKCEIEASREDLEEIETYVEGDVLKIKNRDHFRFDFHDRKVKIYISLPKLNNVGISGSGDILAQTPIKTDELDVKISGSGNVKIESLSAKNLDLSISGSGDIYFAGSDIVESSSYTISGSGDIDTQNLQSKKVEVHISGSGDVRVWSVDELDARVSGSGDVYYKGRPIVDAKSSGSGGIQHIQ